jgi:hypothetical protein
MKLSRKQIYGIAVATIVVVSLLAVYSFYTQPNNEFKAAMLDQLSLTWPNATLTSAINNTLKATGYSLAYYNGSKVNVDLYSRFVSYGYKIVILRVHSAMGNNSRGLEYLDLFTSEPYSNKTHVDDQIKGWLDIAMYPYDQQKYFGITDGFVYGAMQGNLQDAVVIMMGCNGMDGRGYSRNMLEALVNKGAKVVIGWNDTVTASHTDIATEKLLRHLLIENETIKDAVNATNNEMGQQERNKLVYYPLLNPGYPYYSRVDVGNYRIPHGPTNSITTVMGDNFVFFFGTAGFSALTLLPSIKGFRASGRFRRYSSLVFHNALKQ